MKSNWFGIIILLLLIPIPTGTGIIPIGLIVIVLAILSAIAIPSFISIQSQAEVAAAKSTLINGIKECYVRQAEKKTTYFSDIDSFSSELNNFKIVKSSTSKSSDNCFSARAVPTEKIDQHTWFEIKSDPKGKKITKACGDPKKIGCYEGGKWEAPDVDETPSE